MATQVLASDLGAQLSEILERAEGGEEFEITRNGRALAWLGPVDAVRRATVAAAVARMRARLASEPRVSEEEAARNWETLKAEMEAEEDERMDQWFSSSTPR